MLATPPQQAQVQAYLAAETQQSCVVLQHLKQQQVHEQQSEAVLEQDQDRLRDCRHLAAAGRQKLFCR